MSECVCVCVSVCVCVQVFIYMYTQKHHRLILKTSSHADTDNLTITKSVASSLGAQRTCKVVHSGRKSLHVEAFSNYPKGTMYFLEFAYWYDFTWSVIMPNPLFRVPSFIYG